jgi:hypothetical protein
VSVDETIEMVGLLLLVAAAATFGLSAGLAAAGVAAVLWANFGRGDR